MTAYSSTNLPLSDRSNSLDAAASPNYTPMGEVLSHRGSKRNLFSALDSSEATPSDHSSIPDAERVGTCGTGEALSRKSVTGKRNRSRSASWSDRSREEKRARLGGHNFAIRFKNRPNGTPLMPILEQKSRSTLRSKASTLITKPSSTPDRVGSNSQCVQSAPHSVLARVHQISFSVDENILQELREVIDSRLSSDDQLDLDVSRPLSPPEPPVVRRSTPDGARRWPGDLPTSRPGAAPVAPARPRSFANALRGLFLGFKEGASDANRELGRGARRGPRTGRAYWAPPANGHGNLGAILSLSAFDNVEADGAGPADIENLFQNADVENPHGNIGTERHGNDHETNDDSPPRRRSFSLISLPTTPPPDTPSRKQSLVPLALFTTPPYSRSSLGVPDSSYDRISHMLSPSPKSASKSSTASRGNRDDTTSRYTSSGIPVYSPSSASLQSDDRNPESRHSRRSSDGNSSIVTLSPYLPVPPPPTRRSAERPRQIGTTVIRSAALPVLLPIAAAEGIIRPHTLTRPAPTISPLPTARLPRARIPSDATISSSRESMRARRAISGSSATFHTAPQTPRPFSTVEKSRQRGAYSVAGLKGEAGCSGYMGWALRVCFCQPLGGVED